MRRSTALGRYGEDIAVAHLQSQGLVILDRNWRCEVGEIDIVAREGSTLVICEVKTRSSLEFGTPLQHLTPRKIRRLRQLCYRWLVHRQLHAPAVRIDVIGIVQAWRGAPVIEHLRGVE
jgi:putative endonuclease